jgi:hypothetical protein
MSRAAHISSYRIPPRYPHVFWRNAKHCAQWRTTLSVCARAIWGLTVDEVDVAAVLQCLLPIWHAKPETASRLRGRIEAVFDSARVKGFRSSENPAR